MEKDDLVWNALLTAMVLDHSRLGLENKFLENKIKPTTKTTLLLMVLDHSRLGLENKFLENKIKPTTITTLLLMVLDHSRLGLENKFLENKIKPATIRTLTRRAPLVFDSPDSLQHETDYLNNVFSKNNYKTLIPTLRPTSTLAMLRQRLYRTSEPPLKLSHVYYNLTIYVLHTNR